MKKEMNNKGFSLVELIIVVAIMAVLIGVLAPAYLQYVEKSKKTKDCQAVGSIMDAAEIVASDVAINWAATDAEALTAEVTAGGATFTCNDNKVKNQMASIIQDAKITGSWGSIKFEAKKQADGTVKFFYDSGNMNVNAIGTISPDLEARFDG